MTIHWLGTRNITSEFRFPDLGRYALPLFFLEGDTVQGVPLSSPTVSGGDPLGLTL